MEVLVDHRLDDLVEHRRFHLGVHFGGIDLAAHAGNVERVLLFWILNRRVDYRPGVLHRLIAVGRRGKDIERMAEHRTAELMRLVRRRLGDIGFQPFEQLDAIDALTDQIAHRFARLVFGVDDDAGALAPQRAGAARRRPVDDVGRRPHPRPAYGAVLHAVALRRDPLHRIVRDVRAGDHAVGEIQFAHPIAIVAMAVDESRQNSFAPGVDHFGALRNRHLAALADGLESCRLAAPPPSRPAPRAPCRRSTWRLE